VTATDPLRLFEGRWQIERQIEDALTGRGGRLAGLATFSRDGGGLTYHEVGQLQMDGQPAMTAERRYLWRATGPLIRVLFDDGRAFHSFDPQAAAAEAQHDCAPDLYLVRYDFAQRPTWTSRWQVSGPRKNYVMTSVYRPAA
jgi:hypothetical protein